MIKKIFKGLIAGTATLALVGTASAATFDVNIGGASAQHAYWNKAAGGFLTTAYGCTAVDTEGFDKKHGITRGTGCTVDSSGTNDDTVYIRYRSEKSSGACQNAPGCLSYAQADETTCNWGGPLDYNCSATKNTPLHLGAADVKCDTLNQTTFGWEDGRLSYPGVPANYGDAAGYALPARMVTEKPIVVPFGFIANNTVTHTVCTAPVTDPDGAHKAYDKYWWQCVPNAEGQSEDCIGNYKCVYDEGDARYECNGGLNANQPCDSPEDCPDVALENTSCESVPLENVSRLQVLLLFSGQIKNWNQFGPYFPDLPVVLCMRHGGSGTHATLENGVFRGDALVATDSVPVGPNYIWHHTSSTDLTDSCVEYYDGSIGYVDADKALGIDDTGHIHQMKYQGVEPTRGKIVNCEYNYWAAQNIFWDPDCLETAGDYPSTVRTQIVNDLMDYAENPANLTAALFGERAKFWATQAEMNCAKANDYAYPQVK